MGVTTIRILKKSYAMQRMARAIERAVQAATVKEKERAARWVGAWGMLCGIQSRTVRLRRSDVGTEERIRQSSDQIDIPGDIAAPAPIAADSSAPSAPQCPSQLPLSVSGDGAPIAAGIFDPSTPEAAAPLT